MSEWHYSQAHMPFRCHTYRNGRHGSRKGGDICSFTLGHSEGGVRSVLEEGEGSAQVKCVRWVRCGECLSTALEFSKPSLGLELSSGREGTPLEGCREQHHLHLKSTWSGIRLRTQKEVAWVLAAFWDGKEGGSRETWSPPGMRGKRCKNDLYQIYSEDGTNCKIVFGIDWM